jgi:hypothetical protein
VAGPAMNGTADPFKLAEENGLGESTGYYPYRVGLYLSLAIGLTVLLGSLTVLLIVASIKTSQWDGRSIALTVFGAIGTLISIGGIFHTFHVRNRAVFLFDGGFIHVQRPGEPPDVFTWPAIVKVCKRVSVREIGAWRSYTEVDRHLKDGRVIEQWFARDSHSGPVRTTARGRCSYMVWRSDGSMIWLKPEFRNAYELGETILKKAPVSPATRGPDTSTVS